LNSSNSGATAVDNGDSDLDNGRNDRRCKFKNKLRQFIMGSEWRKACATVPRAEHHSVKTTVIKDNGTLNPRKCIVCCCYCSPKGKKVNVQVSSRAHYRTGNKIVTRCIGCSKAILSHLKNQNRGSTNPDFAALNQELLDGIPVCTTRNENFSGASCADVLHDFIFRKRDDLPPCQPVTATTPTQTSNHTIVSPTSNAQNIISPSRSRSSNRKHCTRRARAKRR